VKSPVSNGDPRNESIISDASADITVDSVRDHTNESQQQLLNTTLSSSTSKASIKEPPKAAPIPEESTPIVPEIKEDLVTNGDAEE